MKSFIYLALIALVIFFGFKKLRGSLEQIQGEAELASARTTPESAPFSQISRFALGQYLLPPQEDALTLVQSKDLAPQCKTYLKTVESLDLSPMRGTGANQQKVNYQKLPLTPETCVIADDLVARAEKNYLSTCLLTNPTQTDPITETCFHAFYLYRAILTAHLLEGAPPTSIQSLPLLSQMIMADLLAPTLDADLMPHWQSLVQLAQGIIDQKSTNYIAKVIRARARVGLAMESSQGRTLQEQEKIWAGTAEDLAAVKNAPQGLSSDIDFEVLSETRGFEPRRIEEYSKRLLQESPSGARGNFLRAYSQWKRGDHEEAYQSLKKTIVAAPETDAYKKVLQGLTQPDANEGIFQKAFKIDFTANDFDK